MKKSTRIQLLYRNGVLPERLNELLQNADENDLRFLVTAMMLAERESGETEISKIVERLGLAQTEADASLKFWRGAGVLKTAGVTAKTPKELAIAHTPTAPASPPANVERMTAHRHGALERSGVLGQYSSSELAELAERRSNFAELVDEAQRIMGKVFRTYDTGILMGIVEQLGFEEEAALAVLAYSARRGKKTLRYAEQVAMALYDSGVTETAAVLERIHRMERSGEVVSKIRALFGIGDRELTATEKRLFCAWTEKYAYDIDVIRMAYDITVDTIQKPVPKYTNSILEAWYAEGLRTAEDVQKYLEMKQNGESGADGVVKSYDTQEFFEAALQRSYENLR